MRALKIYKVFLEVEMYQRSPVEQRRNRQARGTLKCPSGRTYQSLRKPTPEGHLSVPLEKGWDMLMHWNSPAML